MAWAKPFTAEEKEYIETVFPQMGATEIAKKLGRSRAGVNNQIKALGLRARRTPCAPAPTGAPAREEGDGQDTLSLLRSLREVQWRALMDAEPRNLPSISAEYRATLAEIARLEGEDETGKEGGDPLDALIGIIGLRPA